MGGKPLQVFIDRQEDDPEVVLHPRIEAAGADLALIETRRPGQPPWKILGDVGQRALPDCGPGVSPTRCREAREACGALGLGSLGRWHWVVALRTQWTIDCYQPGRARCLSDRRVG